MTYNKEETIAIIDAASGVSIASGVFDGLKGKVLWSFLTERYDEMLKDLLCDPYSGNFYYWTNEILFEAPLEQLPLLINRFGVHKECLYHTVYDKEGDPRNYDVTKEGTEVLKALINLRLQWGK